MWFKNLSSRARVLVGALVVVVALALLDQVLVLTLPDKYEPNDNEHTILVELLNDRTRNFDAVCGRDKDLVQYLPPQGVGAGTPAPTPYSVVSFHNTREFGDDGKYLRDYDNYLLYLRNQPEGLPPGAENEDLVAVQFPIWSVKFELFSPDGKDISSQFDLTFIADVNQPPLTTEDHRVDELHYKKLAPGVYVFRFSPTGNSQTANIFNYTVKITCEASFDSPTLTSTPCPNCEAPPICELLRIYEPRIGTSLIELPDYSIEAFDEIMTFDNGLVGLGERGLRFNFAEPRKNFSFDFAGELVGEGIIQGYNAENGLVFEEQISFDQGLSFAYESSDGNQSISWVGITPDPDAPSVGYIDRLCFREPLSP